MTTSELTICSTFQDVEKPTWDDEDGGQEGYLYGMPDFAGEDGGEGMDLEGEGMDFEGMDAEPEDGYDGPINMVRDASPVLRVQPPWLTRSTKLSAGRRRSG